MKTQDALEIQRKNEIRSSIQKSLEGNVDGNTRISARELWLYCVGPGKPISWIKSYKTLLKYVSETYKPIFKPIIVGEGSGTRYYMEIENVVQFLYSFETPKDKNKQTT